MRIFFTIALVFACSKASGGERKRIPSLPDKEGFAGSFAGVSNSALIVAGGANFPAQKPWQGGKKVWHDSVFVLERPDGAWKVAGKLPRPVGYGVSATYGNSLVCVGGSDQNRHYADAFRIEWRSGKLIISELPPLPEPIANSTGALVGDVLYIAGGLSKPDSNYTVTTAWSIDLSSAKPRWNEIEPCPAGGRMLAVACELDGALWLVGGVDLHIGDDQVAKRRYLKDAYRYDPHRGWKRIADLPYPIAAAPSPAPTDTTGLYILGGDDGSQVESAPENHRGFNTAVLRYDVPTDKWSEVGTFAAPQVTVPCVRWNESWVIPGGEVRPGIRTPDVRSWMPRSME